MKNAQPSVPAEPTYVLVAGLSQITRVVVSKIVERSGLRPVSQTPEEAALTLRSRMPCLVILDGGASNTDCDALMEGILTLRRASGTDLPRTILLSTRNFDHEATYSVDAVVAKPLTTEGLQPVIDRLLQRPLL